MPNATYITLEAANTLDSKELNKLRAVCYEGADTKSIANVVEIKVDDNDWEVAGMEIYDIVRDAHSIVGLITRNGEVICPMECDADIADLTAIEAVNVYNITKNQ